MTSLPEISRRARDMYHNLKDDDIMKNIFNSGRHKDKVVMQIPDWMITEEMKQMEHYMMIPSTPRSPNPKMDKAESSALKWSTMIRFRLLERRSTRLTPPAPVPTIDKAYEMILQDTLQISLAEHKSREEQEARENVELVNKHLASEEIENMIEGSENVIDDSLPPRNDEPNIPGTRLEPRSDKESPEVEITNDEEVEITNVVIPVNINEEGEEITDEVYELTRREKGKIVEESRMYVAEGLILERQNTKEEKERMIAKAILHERRNIQAKISSQIQKAIDNQIPSQVDASVPQTTCRPSAVRPRDQDDPHNDAHPEGENRAKRQKTSEYEAYVSGESSSGQVNEEEQGPSTSGNQEQVDDYDFWTDSYALDDDEIPMKQVSQDIMEEVSLTIDEEKLKKMVDEMLRQRCTSRDEHQYHIDQMKNFLKSDIVWESRKEIIVSPHPRKTTPLVQSCQRDPEAPALYLINQDLLYLKKGSLGPEKIVLSLRKFPAIIFNDDDIEE
ncbi:hypothetical protein Tco_0572376 [Tanacetum coccineum]